MKNSLIKPIYHPAFMSPTVSILVLVALTCTGCQGAPATVGQTRAQTVASSPQSAPVTYGPWRAVKMGGGGFMQNIVFSSKPNVLYAYADVTGPWRSDDSGKRWRALYGALPSRTAYGVRSLSVDPRDENTLIIACGSQWTSTDGIYRSTDGGKSWKKVLEAKFYANESGRASGVLLARDPKNPARILAAAGGDGVFASNDNGLTWQKMGAEGIYPTDLKIDASNPNRVWLSAQAQEKIWRDGKQISLGGGFWQSEDGGAKWTKTADVAPSEIVQEASGRLYGLFEKGRSVRQSEDGGQTWTEKSEGLDLRDQHWMDSLNALAVGPGFLLTATQRGVFYRLDTTAPNAQWRKVERVGVEEQYEGEVWMSAMQRGKPGDWQHFGAALGSIIIDPRDPQHWWFTDWYGAYQTRDAGKNWSLSIDGIELTVLHTIIQDPTDPGVVHMGMADNGYLWSDNGGERFTSAKINANMKSVSVSPLLPSRVYGVGNKKPGAWESNQVFVSIDRGKTWTKSPQVGLPNADKFHWNSIVVDPKQPYTVYIGVSGEVGEGKGGVYVSRDGGRKWSWIGQGLEDKGVFRYDIWAIGREIAVSENGTLAAISRDRKAAYYYDATTQTWARAQTNWGNSPHSVVAVPGAPGRFFTGVANDGVYRSDDGGKNWTRVLKEGAEHVAVDAGKPSRIAAGTKDGVYLSEDGGETWKVTDKALPHRSYGIPAFAGERLLVGTGGSGAYWMPLSAVGEKPVQARPVKIAALPGGTANTLTLQNGSMSEGTTTPAGWDAEKKDAAVKVTRDTTNFVQGPASLRLEGEGANSVSQRLAQRSDEFTLSGHVKIAGDLQEALIAVQSFDAGYKQVGWTTILDAREAKATDWTKWEKSLTLPANAAHSFLKVTYRGNGQLWLDEVGLAAAQDVFLPASNEPLTPVTARATLPTLQNGAMSEGAEAPTGWKVGWTGKGTLRAVRDTTQFQTPPAAFRIESVGGEAYGNAGQELKVTTTPFLVSGYVKSDGTLEEASVVVQAFDAGWKQVAWIPLADARGVGDWKQFSGVVKLPASAKSASLNISLKGQGRVWLDEVQVKAAP